MRLAPAQSSVAVGLLLLSLGAGACGQSGAADGFESELPVNGTSPTHAERGADASATLGAGAPSVSVGSKSGQAAANTGAAADRAIAEADIIQVEGDRLYALSRVAGLAVIDIGQPTALRLLGRYRELPAEPFELYLRDGIALVMFSGWGQYVALPGGDYQWVSTSKLLALDVSDPASIRSVGSFDVPGSISDSRIVGDVLYVVAHQDGYCWGCEQSKPLTSIVSLDVSDPHAVQKRDELQYADGNASWGPRSVTVTNQRMYVAGPEYGSDMPSGSTIQVVDIRDPKGDLVQGASVPVHGQISSRWQMDEYAGVLRVISQPPQWWNGNASTAPLPSVQTFTVTSSDKIDPLGQTDIVLPMRETLRSARFDGPRAYAITAEQKDPLFTIDLSDPAHPRQVGELQLPGFVYYMEPRGDRLLGLGFDQGNRAGSITVSLFDVKDLASPRQLSRVNFGGSWGSLPEDQDRIQKVFRVLDAQGLILVPFSGWSDVSRDKTCSQGSYAGGVQVIDFKDDTLRGRGAAPDSGQTRRALLAGEHLLTVSDEHVQAFDIADRDAPQQVSEVLLARNTFRALQLANGSVARISQDGWTGKLLIDLVAAKDAGEPNQSYGAVDLSSVGGSGSACAKWLSIEQAFVHGSQLEILYLSYAQDDSGTQTQGLLVVDASDPEHAQLVSDTHWQSDGKWYPYSGFYSYGYYNQTSGAVRTTHSISMLEASSEYDGVRSIESVRMRVIDLRKPSAVTFTLLPFASSESYSGLIADGDSVLTSHFAAADASAARTRFYVDRFDVSDPSSPRRTNSSNVPGSLLHYDHGSGRVLTSELSRVIVREATSDECYARFAYADFVYNDANSANAGTATVTVAKAGGSGGKGGDTDPVAPEQTPPPAKGICTGYLQRLHMLHLTGSTATLEDTLVLKENQQLTAASSGDGVLFGILGRGGYYGGGALVDCFGRCGAAAVAPEPVELLVLGGFATSKLQQGHIRVDDSRDPWWGFWGTPPVYAFGQRALLLSQNDIAIIDATTPTAPKLARKVPLIASVQYLDMREDTALLTLGAQGVQWLSLK